MYVYLPTKTGVLHKLGNTYVHSCVYRTVAHSQKEGFKPLSMYQEASVINNVLQMISVTK